MLRVATNMQRLSLQRGLDPLYTDELFAAAEVEDTTRFLCGIGYMLAALREHRERAEAA